MLTGGILTFSSQSKLKIQEKDGMKSRISGNGPHNGWRLTYSHVLTHDSSRIFYDDPEGGWMVTYPEHFGQHMGWYEEGMQDGLWRVGLSPDYHLWAAVKVWNSMLVKEKKVVVPPPFHSATIAQTWARAELERRFPERYIKNVKAKPQYLEIKNERKQSSSFGWALIHKLTGVSSE